MTFDVEDGQVVVEEGALVYGVVYSGMIFGSDGYAYQAFNYTSGLEGDRTISLTRLDPQELQLTHNSLDISNRNEDAQIVLTFNQPIELARNIPGSQLREIIDDAFTILSPNLDSDGDVNVLISNIGDDPDERDRGTSLEIDGNTLTLSWARDNSNFADRDDDDPIESVTYNALDQINLRIDDGRVDQEANLATLLGTASLTVFVDGTSATNPLPPLALNSTTPTGNQTTGNVTVEYQFNRDIEFDPDTLTAIQMAESLDNAFAITSTDNVPLGTVNALPAPPGSAATQERGVSISIANDTLTLTWDRTALATSDPADPIVDVTFGSLNSLQIRPVGTTGAEDTTLGALAGPSETFALTP